MQGAGIHGLEIVFLLLSCSSSLCSELKLECLRDETEDTGDDDWL